MTEPELRRSLWTDRPSLQQVQYRTDVNLAARQSIYAYQDPPVDLPAAVLDLAQLHGDEIIADIGCGNGPYLAELTRRGHAGPVLGVDLSPGMLAAARRRAPATAVVVGDAAALPLRANAASLTLAPHMLYHVPDPGSAVRELRRITRPGGQLLVVLNGDDHLRELRDLAGFASFGENLHLDAGQELLAREFGSVIRHDFASELRIPGPEPVAAYVRSMISSSDHPDPDVFAQAVAGRMPGPGPFRVRTHTGCLICT